MTSQGFQHDALPNPNTFIRLLQIEPADPSSALVCTLSDFSISEAPKYAAISYMWGDISLDQPAISLNGRSFAVQRNCLNALTQIRHHALYSYYWIDAICIDQANLTEKASQVQMMGSIYASAGRVLISLGAHSTDSKIIFAHVLDGPRQEQRGSRSKRDRIDAWRFCVNSDQNDPNGAQTWRLSESFLAFGNHDYWSRLWIVQELVVAQSITLLCDFDTIEWVDLADLYDAVVFTLLFGRHDLNSGEWQSKSRRKQHYQLMQTPRSWISQRREQWNGSSGKTYGLEAYLTNGLGPNYRCLNLLDHVYGFLYLIRDAVASVGLSQLQADYTKKPFDLAFESLDCITGTGDANGWRYSGDAKAKSIRSLLKTLQIDCQHSRVVAMLEMREGLYNTALGATCGERHILPIQPSCSGISQVTAETPASNSSHMLDQRVDQSVDQRADQRVDQRVDQRADQRVDQRADQRVDQRGYYCSVPVVDSFLLERTSDGHLSANLRFRQAKERLFIHSLVPSARLPLVSLLSSALERTAEPSAAYSKPQLLRRLGTTVGLVCSKATAGDYLINCGLCGPLLNDRFYGHLVVRQYQGDVFEIVGQALMDSNTWTLCLGGSRCECDGLRHDHAPDVDFKVYFCKEDLVAFAVQDLVNTSSETPVSPQNAEDVESLVEELRLPSVRLVTNVTTKRFSSIVLRCPVIETLRV